MGKEANCLSHYNSGMSKPTDLIAYLFEGKPHSLADELFQWMEASTRYTSFIETYRDKIRKKLRITRDPESILDLRSELDTACGLLGDRRLDIQYEPYASAKRRGPDFAVAYRTNQKFNIEVARMRTPTEERFQRLLLYKLGQMQPGIPNLLVVHTGTELARSLSLDNLMQTIKLKVEKKDPVFYELSRYTSPAAFYKEFLHLSAILLWAVEPQTWVNKQATPPLATEILRVISLLPLTNTSS
jgi:hypothetical protein